MLPRLMLVMVTLATLSLAGQGPAASTPLDDRSAAAAVRRFNEMANGAAQAGSLPRIADPAVRQVLEAAWDRKLTDPRRRAGADDVLVLARFCEAGASVWQRYTDFVPRGRARADVKANIATFGDEIMPGLAFSARCTATLMEATVAYLARLPADQRTETRQDGLDRVRIGASQVARGLLTTMDESPIPPAHAAILATALTEVAPRLAAGLEPAQRRAVAARARQAAGVAHLATVRPALVAFAQRVDAP